MQERVREKFNTLRKIDEELGRTPWYTLDARKSKEELQTEIKEIVQRVLERVQNEPIGQLWTSASSH